MSYHNDDLIYMRRCLQTAANGLGRTRPNPLVGCVIVKNHSIISEGFHQQYGGYHAERNAILNCKTKNLLQGATLYVNLEPCSHYGHTPPCANQICESGIKRVVVCNDDPNPRVNGNGYRLLREAGIEVEQHVLEAEGRFLNRRFFTFQEQHRPYIILKWAESSDGFISPYTSLTEAQQRQPYWLSSTAATVLSHKWRTEEQAILIGSQTFIDDHPRLTARLYRGSNPIRYILDRRGRVIQQENWNVLNDRSANDVVAHIYKDNIQSIIIEGGQKVLQSFIDSELYDEVRIITTPKRLFQGTPAPVFKIDDVHTTIVTNIYEDILTTVYRSFAPKVR